MSLVSSSYREGASSTGKPLFPGNATDTMPTTDESRDSDKNRDKVHEMLRRLLDDADSALSRSCAVRAAGKMGGRETIPTLIELLRDEQPDLRVDAAVALGILRATEAVSALVENIENDPEGEVRIEAVKALGKIGSKDAVAPLIRCFEAEGYPALNQLSGNAEYGSWFEVQRRALEALGEIGDERAIATVVAALENEDYEDLQENAIRVLSRLDASRARQFLIGQMKSGGRLARRRALRALANLPAFRAAGGDLPGETLVPLVGALTDTDPDVRIAAAQALAGSENPMVAVSLLLLLNDPDPTVATEVAALFSGMRGEGVQGVRDRLHAMLATTDPVLKARVVQVLGNIGDAASAALLVPILDAGERDLVFEAIRALGKIGARGPEGKLAEILADANHHHTVRIQASWALGRMGDAAAAGEALKRALADTDDRVAQAALSAWVELSPSDAVGDLAAILRSTPGADAPGAGDASLNALRDLVADQTPQTSTLAAILAADEARAPAAAAEPSSALPLRLLAARLLGGIAQPGPLAEAALTEACESKEASLRREALRALARLGGERAVSALVAGLDSEDKEVRQASIDALQTLDAAHAAGGRLAALLNDPDAGVRVSVVRALAKASKKLDGPPQEFLGSLGGEPSEARFSGGAYGERVAEFLCMALGDAHIQVCRAALDALNADACTPACRDEVLALMFRFSGELRMKAAATLRRLNDYAVTDRLIEAAADPGREAHQWIAIDALGELYAEESAQ